MSLSESYRFKVRQDPTTMHLMTQGLVMSFLVFGIFVAISLTDAVYGWSWTICFGILTFISLYFWLVAKYRTFWLELGVNKNGENEIRFAGQGMRPSWQGPIPTAPLLLGRRRKDRELIVMLSEKVFVSLTVIDAEQVLPEVFQYLTSVTPIERIELPEEYVLESSLESPQITPTFGGRSSTHWPVVEIWKHPDVVPTGRKHVVESNQIFTKIIESLPQEVTLRRAADVQKEQWKRYGLILITVAVLIAVFLLLDQAGY